MGAFWGDTLDIDSDCDTEVPGSCTVYNLSINRNVGPINQRCEYIQVIQEVQLLGPGLQQI